MKRILFYGDSLTYGYDPRGNFGSRFPESVRWTQVLMQRTLQEWDIIVKARNGREIPETPFEMKEAKEKIISCLPFDVFAVMLGTNDYLNMYQPDVVEVTGRMKKFLEEVQKIDEVAMLNVRFLLIAPPLIHTLQDEFYAKYDTSNGVFSRAYLALAEHMNIFFADAGSWGLENAFDGIHMSEGDNAIFADHIEQVLSNISLRIDMDRMEAAAAPPQEMAFN